MDKTLLALSRKCRDVLIYKEPLFFSFFEIPYPLSSGLPRGTW